jgi:hypothetical protein
LIDYNFRFFFHPKSHRSSLSLTFAYSIDLGGRNLAELGIDASAELAARLRRRSSWLRIGSNPQTQNNLVQRKLALCLETGTFYDIYFVEI